jgi:hypothetical protein
MEPRPQPTRTSGVLPRPARRGGDGGEARRPARRHCTAPSTTDPVSLPCRAAAQSGSGSPGGAPNGVTRSASTAAIACKPADTAVANEPSSIEEATPAIATGADPVVLGHRDTRLRRGGRPPWVERFPAALRRGGPGVPVSVLGGEGAARVR